MSQSNHFLHLILALGIGCSPAGGLEQAIAQSQKQEATEDSEGQDGETGRVNHDHSESFYSKTYSIDNIPDLEKELKIHPTSRGYIRLSDVYWDTKRIQKAKMASITAIRLDPKDWEGYQNLGACLSALGNHEEGIKLLEKAVKLSPRQPTIYQNLGVIEVDNKRYSSALSFFKKAVQIDPNFGPALESIKEINEKLHIYK